MMPSVLAHHVEQGIQDFLRTTFLVTTTFFSTVIERFLNEPGTLFKGPYVDMQLPFLQGKKKGDYNELKTASYKISEVGDFFKVELLEIRSNDVKIDPVKAFIDSVKGFIDPVKDLENRFNLTKNQSSILTAVVENKKNTQKKLAEIVGITRKNILNNMKKLKEKGVLKRVGSVKTGYLEMVVKLSETDKKNNGMI